MTSKQRSYLIGLAAKLDPVVQIGKEGITPEIVVSADEVLETRELIKVNVQKNCFDDLNELAATLAERTRAQVIKVIGRKLILYRESRTAKNKIELPAAGRTV